MKSIVAPLLLCWLFAYLHGTCSASGSIRDPRQQLQIHQMHYKVYNTLSKNLLSLYRLNSTVCLAESLSVERPLSFQREAAAVQTLWHGFTMAMVFEQQSQCKFDMIVDLLGALQERVRDPDLFEMHQHRQSHNYTLSALLEQRYDQLVYQPGFRIISPKLPDHASTAS